MIPLQLLACVPLLLSGDTSTPEAEPIIVAVRIRRVYSIAAPERPDRMEVHGFGYRIQPVDDLDGDGLEDYVVGGQIYSSEGSYSHALASAHSGRTGELIKVLPRVAMSVGREPLDYQFERLGNLGADHWPEIAFVHRGKWSGDSPGSSIVSIGSREVLASLAGTVHPVGDWNGDGLQDYGVRLSGKGMTVLTLGKGRGGSESARELGSFHSTLWLAPFDQDQDGRRDFVERLEDGAVRVYSGRNQALLAGWNFHYPPNGFTNWQAGVRGEGRMLDVRLIKGRDSKPGHKSYWRVSLFSVAREEPLVRWETHLAAGERVLDGHLVHDRDKDGAQDMLLLVTAEGGTKSELRLHSGQTGQPLGAWPSLGASPNLRVLRTTRAWKDEEHLVLGDPISGRVVGMVLEPAPPKSGRPKAANKRRPAAPAPRPVSPTRRSGRKPERTPGLDVIAAKPLHITKTGAEANFDVMPMGDMDKDGAQDFAVLAVERADRFRVVTLDLYSGATGQSLGHLNLARASWQRGPGQDLLDFRMVPDHDGDGLSDAWLLWDKEKEGRVSEVHSSVTGKKVESTGSGLVPIELYESSRSHKSWLLGQVPRGERTVRGDGIVTAIDAVTGTTFFRLDGRVHCADRSLDGTTGKDMLELEWIGIGAGVPQIVHRKGHYGAELGRFLLTPWSTNGTARTIAFSDHWVEDLDGDHCRDVVLLCSEPSRDPGRRSPQARDLFLRSYSGKTGQALPDHHAFLGPYGPGPAKPAILDAMDSHVLVSLNAGQAPRFVATDLAGIGRPIAVDIPGASRAFFAGNLAGSSLPDLLIQISTPPELLAIEL